jgi:Acyl-protein synthetase, LuxE.
MTELLALPPYSVPAPQKQALLLAELNQLVLQHRQHCPEYNNLLNAYGLESNWQANTVAEIPPIAVALFKTLTLKSVADCEIFKTLYSSGTTGTPSRIVLDRTTATLQTQVLVKIMQQWLGKERLPMLIIDHPKVITDRQAFSARGAGIQGLAFMGRNHTYALNDDMSLNLPAITSFCEQFQNQPVLLFGFTFMVWQYFLTALAEQGIELRLSHGTLLHSGGWKKLTDKAVDNVTFKRAAMAQLNIAKVHNFYGMVEQVGTIFVECEHGYLHCPSYADVLVRRPGTWQSVAAGKTGVLELVSILPRSYPGHVILSEDQGIWLGEDDCPCGRLGRYFTVSGRLPKAEARGCSDTFQELAA